MLDPYYRAKFEIKLMKYSILILLIFSAISLRSQHTMVLQSGDKIEGVVLGLKNDVWTIFIDGKEKTVSMKDVASVFFKEYVPYNGVFVSEAEEKTLQVDGFTVKYQIIDRELVRNPEVSIGTQDKGAVVVKITVDRYGNIRSANAGAPGSTTSSAYLYAKAVTAAKSAKFNENLKGPLITEGTITIIY